MHLQIRSEPLHNPIAWIGNQFAVAAAKVTAPVFVIDPTVGTDQFPELVRDTDAYPLPDSSVPSPAEVSVVEYALNTSAAGGVHDVAPNTLSAIFLLVKFVDKSTATDSAPTAKVSVSPTFISTATGRS